MSKGDLRQNALRSRRAIPRTRIAEMSRLVEGNLVAQREFESARRIASYVAREDEVQTAAILEGVLSRGKSVVVPLVDPPSDRLLFFEIHSLRDLSPGRFGIPEPKRADRPIPLSETDVVLVPMVAWDVRGHRLGHGRGYFDRALAERGPSLAIGLAFESQSVPRVPEEPSDVQMDMVVTEKGAFRFGRNAS